MSPENNTALRLSIVGNHELQPIAAKVRETLVGVVERASTP